MKKFGNHWVEQTSSNMAFQVFYWSHLLYVSYWVLLILHAPNFWKWFVAPATLFLVEKGFRIARSLSEVTHNETSQLKQLDE
jgi:hypothetical protein